MVIMTVAADQVRGTTANTEFIRTALERRNHIGMVGQAKIIIAAEVEIATPVDHGLAPAGMLLRQALAIAMLVTARVERGAQVKGFRHGRYPSAFYNTFLALRLLAS